MKENPKNIGHIREFFCGKKDNSRSFSSKLRNGSYKNQEIELKIESLKQKLNIDSIKLKKKDIVTKNLSFFIELKNEITELINIDTNVNICDDTSVSFLIIYLS